MSNYRNKKLTQSAKHESCVSCGADDGITQEFIKAVLHYDQISGDFIWIARIANCIQIGQVAGYLDSSGYKRIKLNGKLYSQHRLAFLYMNGFMPDLVDHINGDRGDNRWANLRSATIHGNNANKKSKAGSSTGLKGVTYQKSRGNWRAKIRVNGKTYHLGEFKTPDDAHKAYCLASSQMNGEFHCDGNR